MRTQASATASWLANTLQLRPRRLENMAPHWAIDGPLQFELVYQHGFDCHGWIHDDAGRVRRIEVGIDGTSVGSTEIFYDRPDVAEAFNRAAMLRVGFTVRCNVPEALRAKDRVELCFTLVAEDGARVLFARQVVHFSKVDYRNHGHGTILTNAASGFLKREQVYGSGPPSPIADPVCVDLVTRYLPLRSSVLDVGCGIGAWCGPLTSYGVQWTGCETRKDFVERMLASELRAICVEGNTLPFEDDAFDYTISIEVLEHVPDHESFLAEVSRVSRHGALFSVPNFGAIPITSSFYALPWHMLESDHKNFFTARSLEKLLNRYYEKVETFEYGPLPQLRSLDGIQVKNHVFAVARH